MPNIKSAIKRVKTNKKRQLRNRMAKSEMKTTVKKAVAAIESGDIQAAEKALPGAFSQISKTAKKGVIKKNAAARRASRLAKRFNKAKAAAQGQPTFA